MTLAALEFLDDGLFWTAVALAGAAAAVVALTARRSRTGGALTGLAGLALVLPVLTLLADRYGVPLGLVLGLALLGLAGASLDARRSEPVLAVLVACGGAWLIAWRGDLVPVTWIRLLVFATTVAGGLAVASFDRRWGAEGYTAPFVALAAAGVYVTVPDPYDALVLFGCSLPVALLGWRRPLARLGASGALMTAGLLAWVVARDGYGRQSSIIGGVACLGLLLLEPLMRRRHHGRSALDALPPGALRSAGALGGQMVLVLVASRIAGLQSPTPFLRGGTQWRGAVTPAVAIVGAAWAVALLVIEVASQRVRSHPQRHRRRRP